MRVEWVMRFEAWIVWLGCMCGVGNVRGVSELVRRSGVGCLKGSVMLGEVGVGVGVEDENWPGGKVSHDIHGYLECTSTIIQLTQKTPFADNAHSQAPMSQGWLGY